MKLTAKEMKRLMELLTKGATNLSDAEKAELTTLQTKANASTDDDSMTADDVKTTVETAVKNAMTAAAAGGKQLTADEVKTTVETAVKALKVPGFDDAALAKVVDGVKAAFKPGVSADEVKTIVADAIKSIPAASKMQHGNEDTLDIDFPVTLRKGNLPVDAKQLLNVMLGKSLNDGIDETQLTTAGKRGDATEAKVIGMLKRSGVNGQKALTTTGVGTGAEFMNSLLSSTLLQRFYMESAVAAAFVANEVQMPSNPFTYPLSTTRPAFYVGAEQGGMTSSDGGTGNLVLNAKKLTGKSEYSYEAEEDALIAILPQVLAGLAAGGSESLENAIINGDTAATHQDSDYHAVANHAAKLFDGIRKLTLAQASLKLSLATGGLSATNVGLLKKALGRWGLNPKDLLIIAGVNGYNDLIMLPETLTAEKTGNAATARILTGVVPSLLGIDIVPSAMVRENLNASGVYDGATMTKGSFFIVHKPSWIMGVRRGFTLEQDKDITAQKKWVVASFRRDFKPIESLANTKAAVIGYNY